MIETKIYVGLNDSETRKQEHSTGAFVSALMRKNICLILAMLVCLCTVLNPAAHAAEPDPSAGSDVPFVYEHNPCDNPSAMRDIVVNPDAVYGFSPSAAEDSTLKEYVDLIDWTDAEQVAPAREQRLAYHESLEELYDMILEMTRADQDIETIARAVSQRRNELRLEAYKDDPEGLETVKKRNLETYGNEFGPTQDSLYEKYGSWETVLLKALGTNPGMDACLGFYDEYYYLYLLEDSDLEDPEAEDSEHEDSEVHDSMPEGSASEDSEFNGPQHKEKG